jgi:SNF2 family DNA or RNA helicase
MVQFDFPDGGRTVLVRTHYDNKDRCAAVPGGRWVPRERAWEYLFTPTTASALLQSFSGKMDENDRQKLQDAATRLTIAQSVKNGEYVLASPESNTTPWHHQLVCYNMAREILGLDVPDSCGGGTMLALDMGCGKSLCAVNLITNHPNKFRKVLIVCPVSVIDVWAGNHAISGQFERHATEEQYSKLIIHPVKGISVEKKTKAAEMARFTAMNAGKQFICVINYESAWREPFAKWAHDVGFDLIVLDESHRIKTPSGKASKFFSSLAKTVKYRIALTGTPIPHSPLDIYGQYRFLDPGVFGTSYTKFRSDFAVMGGFQGHQVLNYKNIDTLHNKMFLLAHRVMSKDVFDLPEFLSETRTCTLNKDERALYDQMNDTFCAEVQGGMVTAANALVKLLRLQEITSGYLDKLPIGDSKRKLLADVLEDFDVKEPIIIFARFTNDLKAVKEIAESQGRTYGELSGHANNLAEWQNGNKDVLGVQIKSGREGVDFTRARYSIYYSLGFSLGDYEQSIKRLDRPGQLRQGMYIHLLAEDSIDFKVMEALEKKQEVVESVLKQYRDEIPDFDIPDDLEASIN